MLNKIASKYLEKIADESIHNAPYKRLMYDMYAREAGLPVLFDPSNELKQVAGGIGDTLLSFVDSMVKPSGVVGWKGVNRALAAHYAAKAPTPSKKMRDAIEAADPVVTQYIPDWYKSALKPKPYKQRYVDLRNELDMGTVIDYNGVDSMLNKDAESWYKATLPTNQLDHWIRGGANFASTAALYAALFNTNIAPALASRLGVVGKVAGKTFDLFGPDYFWEKDMKYLAEPSDDFRNWAIQKYYKAK